MAACANYVSCWKTLFLTMVSPISIETISFTNSVLCIRWCIENLVPNFAIASRIYLTLPVSFASGKRLFSKLKLIENICNSMKQDRLNGLAIISIERDIVDAIEYDDVIEDFAHTRARKKNLI